MIVKPSAPAARGPEDRFVGAVHATDIAGRDAPVPLAAALVHFAPGARTNWHSHPHGQVLFVTEGAGLVATRDGTVTDLRPGDTVHALPGEEHWHGATTDTELCHVAMVGRLGDEPQTIWLEPVTDEVYGAANTAARTATNRTSS